MSRINIQTRDKPKWEEEIIYIEHTGADPGIFPWGGVRWDTVPQRCHRCLRGRYGGGFEENFEYEVL